MAVLEEFLLSYAGVLVVVSHDRYFLDKVCDHHFVLSSDGTGEVLDWQGSFSEYLQYRTAKAATEAEAAAASVRKAAGASGGAGAAAGDDNDGGGDSDGGDGAEAAVAVAEAAPAEKKPLSNFEVSVKWGILKLTPPRGCLLLTLTAAIALAAAATHRAPESHTSVRFGRWSGWRGRSRR